MNKNYRITKKTTTCILSITMIGLLAGYTTLPAFAAESSTKKEEIVYANLSSSGSTDKLYVVNRFDTGDIIDYGNYDSVKNLTSNDAITEENGTIRIHSDADSLYYQGNLSNKELPWNISIHYYLNGRQVQADELAGANGALKIKLSIKKNNAGDENFYKGFALQSTVTLDAKTCSDIKAKDATISNVGGNKQLSYITLPGKGADYTITANVTDFEMDPISINAMQLNLNIDLDTSELTDTLSTLESATKQLSEGAENVHTGTKKITTGATQLNEASASLKKGTGSLKSGVTSLNKGIKTVNASLKTLNKKSKNLKSGSKQTLTALTTIQTAVSGIEMDTEALTTLASSSTQIKQGIQSLTAGLATMDNSITTYQQSLTAAGITDMDAYINQHDAACTALKQIPGTDSIVALLNADKAYIQGSSTLINGMDAALDPSTGTLRTGAIALQNNYETFDASIQSMVSSLSSLAVNLTTLQTGINTLVENYRKLDNGITEYTAGVAKLQKGYQEIVKGSAKAVSGTKELYTGTNRMAKGTNALAQSLTTLSDGTSELADKSREFYEKTDGIEDEMNETIDDKIAEYTGKDIACTSFVSDKNKEVTSVLFVLQTPKIEKEEVETVEVSKETKQTMLDKFKNLFSK